MLFLVLPFAQSEPAKRALAHADFDAWRSVATPTLSRDGQWLAYSLQPQAGDGELVVREAASGKESRYPVGALPPVVLTPNAENPNEPPPPRAIRVVFTSDSRFLVATTHPSVEEMAQARKARKKPEEMPRTGLLVIDLAQQTATRIASVKSVQVPARGGAWLAYQKEDLRAAPEGPGRAAGAGAVADDDAGDESGNEDQAGARAPGAAPGATAGVRRPTGTDLVLRNLATGAERVFANVTDSSFVRDGKSLVYITAASADSDAGVFAVTPQSQDAAQRLLSGKGRALGMTWDREQTQLAFLSDHGDGAARAPRLAAFLWPRGTPVATEQLNSVTPGFPAGWTLTERPGLAFSRDGQRLMLSAAPQRRAARPTEGDNPEDKVVLDLWHWRDPQVQAMQQVRAAQERSRSFRGVFDIAQRRYTQLGDESLRSVSLSEDARRAVGADARAYATLGDHDGAFVDVYVIDPASAKRTRALTRLRGNGNFTPAQWSPDGQWIAYFEGDHWHALNTSDGSTRALTATLGVPVHNPDRDVPGPAPAFGQAGWLRDSSSLLIYDRYDVWQVFVDGRAARNVTQGLGRRTQVQLRVQPNEPRDDAQDSGIDPGQAINLRGEHEDSRASGYLRTRLDASAAPQRLIWADANLRVVARAQSADAVLMTSQTFATPPDLQLTNAAFRAPQRVSDVAAQLKPLHWGRAERLNFTSAKGVALKANLIKPEGFDPAKKYPLMVYLYERLSQNLHNFVVPSPSNTANPSLWTSNGYVVLMPDIVYTTGQPGQSALDAVLPAVEALTRQGFIDEQAIGIQGHSWGGYQIAWMLTQTQRFKAAKAGAPVANMTSAYTGIRWGSGQPRLVQYEQGQSRIGKPMHEALDLYIANSPVFQATKITTPLLMIANDADDAVPWYQGIELFLTLRRLQKETYLFNYNGQLHNLRRRADQMDFSRRTFQFFEHHLRGAQAPEWMQRGIPFIDREEEKERFRQTLKAPALPAS